MLYSKVNLLVIFWQFLVHYAEKIGLKWCQNVTKNCDLTVCHSRSSVDHCEEAGGDDRL